MNLQKLYQTIKSKKAKNNNNLWKLILLREEEYL